MEVAESGAVSTFQTNILTAHLYKVINHCQGDDDEGEEGCGQADDEERPKNAHKTQNPGADTLRDGLVHGENVLQDIQGLYITIASWDCLVADTPSF